MTRITQQQLEAYLWGAATRLRGTIDAGDYKQFIFPLLFFKRLSDVYDEEVVAAMEAFDGDEEEALRPENHRFQIPEGAHWSDVRESSKDMGRAIQKAMRDIEAANPDKLAGIFGDAQWTNKDRLSDAMLRDLIEHFSSLELKIANLPEDELGNGYEYLIKKFADDSGHTAAEFYTNRTVVHLMTEMLQPQPGESIYDPTCGSGGMLLSAVAHLKNQGKEWRNVKLYGQERNLMTSSIARMNCFLHGIEEFDIQRGDTLSDPKFVKGDKLQRFDVIFANPPYSIKQWDREAFASDKWGRNQYGTPPQGRADYAFWQHILASMDQKEGRCAILFPHGVLFRQEEEEMRLKLVQADIIECVVGLGPGLFYNSPMEACVVVCRNKKAPSRKGKILLINAVDEFARIRSQNYLEEANQRRIVASFQAFADDGSFARVVTTAEVTSNGGSLSLPLYLGSSTSAGAEEKGIPDALNSWLEASNVVQRASHALLGNHKARARAVKATARKEIRATFGRRRSLRFGEIVQNVNTTSKSPVERFVGLEHMVPGVLQVRTWGDASNGTTFTRLCQPGQVLFGKRRAYQRKIAVANFEAVVSGDIYVFSAKDNQLNQDLLPFVCLSPAFYKHALDTSAGSLSPRTSWTSLADFELSLPDHANQARLTKLLVGLDEYIQRLETLRKALRQARNRAAEHHFANVVDSRPLQDAVAESLYGPRFSSSLYSISGTLAQLRTTDICDTGGINYTTIPRANISPSEFADHVLQSGDVLITRSGTCGIAAVWQDQGFPTVPGAFLIRLRLKSELLEPEYLRAFVNSGIGQRLVGGLVAGGVQKNLRASALLMEKVPIPSLKEQRNFLGKNDQFVHAEEAVELAIGRAQELLIAMSALAVGAP